MRVTRNTPADAGNLRFGDRKTVKVEKHPRRCGEPEPPTDRPFLLLETPPQMRGTLRYEGLKKTRLGNTPADAGNLLLSQAFYTFF